RYMRPVVLCFLYSITVLAQPAAPPVDLALRAYGKAHIEGRFDEAGARREDARAVLRRVPAEAPQFLSWGQQVAQIYQGAGMNIQARAVMHESLDQGRGLGDSHGTRMALLNMLADSWQQDGNLLKSVSYLEQAVAAAEAGP